MVAAVGASIAAFECIRRKKARLASQSINQPVRQTALTTQTSTRIAKKRGSGFSKFLSAALDFGKSILGLGLRIGAVGFAVYGGLALARGLFQLVAGRATALGVRLVTRVATPSAMAA